jgi:hypothetical protein
MKRIVLTWLALCAALFGAWQLSALDIPHFKSAHIERLLVTPAHAQLTLTGAGRGAPSSGSGLTWTSTDAEANAGCGYSNPCSVSVSVNAGLACTYNVGTAPGSTMTCTSALTVPSNGVAIGVAFQRAHGSFGFTNMTVGNDVQGSDGSEMQNGSNTTAGSLTPTGNISAFTTAAIAANTWH